MKRNGFYTERKHDEVLVEIGEIGNVYGGLNVTAINGKYYFGIETYDASVYWEEITQTLYTELLKHNEKIISERMKNEQE